MLQIFQWHSSALDYQIILQVPCIQLYFEPNFNLCDSFSQPSTYQMGSEDPYLMLQQAVNQEKISKEASVQHSNTKSIEQRVFQDTSYDASQFLIIKMKPSERRKRGAKPKGYPTKNFLQNFKTPHFDFLENYYGVDYVMSFQEAKKIKEKKGINMKDYEILYNIPEFQDAFIKFFKSKILYRYLITSRSIQGVKKIHQRKLNVFEDAFRRKKFQKIN